MMSKNKTLLSALLTMLLWGSLFPMVKLGFAAYEIDGTADILLFAGIRFVICGGVICAFSAVKNKGSFQNVKNSIFPILLSGMFAIILHYGFTYLGLELTDSSKTALLKQVGALVYVCFSFIFIKEDKPSVKKIVASLIGFLGILALNIDSQGFSFGIGDILILCASFCTVFSNVISKRVFKTVDPVAATGISQLFGGGVLLFVGLAMGGSVHFSPDFSLFIMAYICIASIISYCIWYGIVKGGELSQLFIIKFAEPVFACVFGAILLGEDILKPQYFIAFILISVGICIANSKSDHHKK
ncbi:MAG: DMT family transporter [Clostridia bacterium]|nr:DMT family transporter [Clostridia bacterium]